MNFKSRASAVTLLLLFYFSNTDAASTSQLYVRNTQFDGYTCSSGDFVKLFDSVRNGIACVVRCLEHGCLDVFYYPETRKCQGCYTFHSDDLYPAGPTGGSLHYQPVLECPWSFVKFNTSCYKITTAELPWISAQNECASENAYLAVIDDATENGFIENLLEYTAVESSDYMVYFGLTDQQEEGTWRAVNGDNQTYFNWAVGEPGSWFISWEDCVAINIWNKEWHALRCEVSHLAICEMDLI